jgi:hypothetical protein
MKAHPTVRTGQCRCGRIAFEATPPVLLTMACHCVGCQRMTGSAFSLSAMYAASRFRVTKGEPVIGGMKAFPPHYMCATCSSWVFTKISTPAGDYVNVRATMFDQADHQAPYIETCTAEKLAWVQTGAAHSFEVFPPREEFANLINEYVEATS